MATWREELTHLKRPWCWERLKAGGEGDDSGWDGWMASLTRWTWFWVNSSWWWTGRPSVLRSMESQRVGHDWATELTGPTNRYLSWGSNPVYLSQSPLHCAGLCYPRRLHPCLVSLGMCILVTHFFASMSVPVCEFTAKYHWLILRLTSIIASR